MIRRIYRLCPEPGLLTRLWLPGAVLAVLQGLVLGTLVPILRALLRPEPDFAAAAPWLLTAGLGVVVYAVATVVATPMGLDAVGVLAVRLRHLMMNHVTGLPPGWFTAERRGELVHTVTTVTHHLAMIPFVAGSPALTCVLLPLTTCAVVCTVDWRVGMLLLAFLPVALLLVRRLRHLAAAGSVDMEIAGKEVVARVLEYGQAQPVLRAAGHAGTGTARMRAALADHERRRRRVLIRSLPTELGYNGLVALAFTAVLALTVLLLEDTHPVADIAALLVLATHYAEPLAELHGHASGLGAMDYLADQVEEVLAQSGLPANPDAKRLISHVGVTFDRVTFGYGQQHPALREVTFDCPPGSTTALVDPSGAGKTTVIRLAARFLDTDDGQVRVGGHDVRDIDHALLEHVAVVFQHVYLFDTTIEANVRLARPEATEHELATAARAARLDEVIERLPDGWHTRVGEGGAQLSGGERQRVSIARAFLKDAPIVLIDEAASALDPESERTVADAIADLATDRERTVLVVAHRPTTLAAATQVVALHSGRVAETGTPTELLTAGGVYARLYEQYHRVRGWRLKA